MNITIDLKWLKIAKNVLKLTNISSKVHFYDLKPTKSEQKVLIVKV